MNSTRSIRESFARLIGSLQSARPPVRFAFRPPASLPTIRAAESSLGVTLPPQLVEFLLLADGQYRIDECGNEYDYLLPGMLFGNNSHCSAHSPLCGISDIVRYTLLTREVRNTIRSNGFVVDGPDASYDKYGPVAIHDSVVVISTTDDPAIVCLDLSPPAGGNFGQVLAVNDQPNAACVLAIDLIEFLDILAAGYRDHRFHRVRNFWTECDIG